ncbi:MAG: hypothetical protein JRF15_10870 [Deltaproteobacteria bacterium]|jgi:hypothetical protein|nr:hypothetical protein [Deltaproteobacteria bacterium]
MRVAQNIPLAVAIALQVALGSACTSPVPPTVTRAPRVVLKANPTIFLQATAQQPRIAESLRQAGVQLVDSYGAADYILNVNVGRRRGSMACGGTNNVAYILDGREGHLLVMKGRGLTGTCTPNIFVDMSQKLVTYFGS